MSSKNLVLLIVAHQGYIRHLDDKNDYSFENDILFSSISGTYLPLLNLLEKIENGTYPNVKISLVLSPTLCELLADSVIQEQYIEWLDKRIFLGEQEVSRCSDEKKRKIVEFSLNKAKKDKLEFCDKYFQNLLGRFSYFAEKGFVELLATCGTYAYLPHYADIPEVLNAQVETGLYAHRKFFGVLPNGFYLPYLGYCDGIEKILRSYGMNFSIVDNHGFFFSKDEIKKGIFAPIKCDQLNPLVFFAQDTDTNSQIVSFSENNIYKDASKDIGFDLSLSELDGFISEGQARIPTGYRYYTNNSEVYDSEQAAIQIEKDAEIFVKSKIKKLCEAEQLLNDDVSLVCTIPAEYLGRKWREGFKFFEKVIEKFSKQSEINLSSGFDVLKSYRSQKKDVQIASIYPCADTGDGFAENHLDSSNSWMVRYTRKMCERMVDISDRFPNDTGLKIRLLNLGARELLLAQSGEWAEMVRDDDSDEENPFVDYAKMRFNESIKSFIIVYDSLGSNTVSTEWLTNLEKKHNLFPWMNFRIFSKKK